MKPETLFHDQLGNQITETDFISVLEKLRAFDCDILYIHTALNFGMPDPRLSRTELLERLLNIIFDLKVPTICMPTYTFSFCNGKSYDRAGSKSRMGALNEYFRTQQDVIRSSDPLMSVALKGIDKSIVTDIGNESCGRNSSFDILRKKSNVRFLFFGPGIGDCFTYMHYLEWLYGVDYRYNRSFKGTVIDNGIPNEKENILFVRYNGVNPNNGSYLYENEMYKTGIATKVSVGNASVSIVSEQNAAECYKEFLDLNPYFFVETGSLFEKKDKTFVLTKEMVAL